MEIRLGEYLTAGGVRRVRGFLPRAFPATNLKSRHPNTYLAWTPVHPRSLIVFMGVVGLITAFPATAQNTASQKAAVAVDEPVVGEGISESVQAHLNKETIRLEIEASLRKTRKFRVLTRESRALESIRDEQEFAESTLTRGDAAETGLLANADYKIIPIVNDFKFYRSISPVPNIQNKYFRQDVGMLELNAQVFDTVTGEIKANYSLKSNFRTKRQVVNSRGGSPSSVRFTRMAKDIAAQMADELVDTVFLMRVLERQGSQVWINRGDDGGLKAGDILHVYRPGPELIDPDTGESLGTAEQFMGEIEVSRVNPKFTIAEIRKTEDPGQIKRGDIVREP